MNVERDRELRRRRARRTKTKWLKARIAAAADNRQRAKLVDKLKRINLYVQDVK